MKKNKINGTVVSATANPSVHIHPPPKKKNLTPKTLRLGLKNLLQRVSSNYHTCVLVS